LLVRTMSVPGGRVGEAYAQLKKMGLRLTPQRMAIARYVLSTDSHPTAEEVYRRVKPQYSTISLATVYSTLDMLTRAGMLRAVTTKDAIRFDSNPSEHVNLVCMNCGRIVDVNDKSLGELAERKAGKINFRIVDKQFVLYGYCEDCRASVP